MRRRKKKFKNISSTDHNGKTLAKKLDALDPLEITVQTILHQIENIMDKSGHPLYQKLSEDVIKQQCVQSEASAELQ